MRTANESEETCCYRVMGLSPENAHVLARIHVGRITPEIAFPVELDALHVCTSSTSMPMLVCYMNVHVKGQ